MYLSHYSNRISDWVIKNPQIRIYGVIFIDFSVARYVGYIIVGANFEIFFGDLILVFRVSILIFIVCILLMWENAAGLLRIFRSTTTIPLWPGKIDWTLEFVDFPGECVTSMSRIRIVSVWDAFKLSISASGRLCSGFGRRKLFLIHWRTKNL